MPRTSGRPSGRRGAATQRAGGETVEDIRALSEVVDDGDEASVAPADGSAGALNDEMVGILSAKFAKDQPMRKNEAGELEPLENTAPRLKLFVEFEREDADKPYIVRYTYANFKFFGTNKDGTKCIRRDKTSTMQPRRDSAGALFLQSIVDSSPDGPAMEEALRKDGLAALVGLRVHVQNQTVGEGEYAKDWPMVTFIEGVSESGETEAPEAQGQAAPAAAEEQSSDADDFTAAADEILLEALANAKNNKIGTTTLPTELLKVEKWKKHPQRGQILKLVRSEDFLGREDATWNFDGKTISL